ncbi:hypothetical protein [Kordiimonas pumila]|uniref:DUF883 domain-containing protein n=1 Tax=Kordiimonas pumila TaxID=2161677 RepID=A0ABV7D3K3_9PROT|nr:hypothetical protein [Kordiimonas pumila]
MTTAQQEIKSLKKDLAQIKDILADHAENVVSNGASKSKFFDVDEVKDQARRAGVAARKYLHDKQDQVIVARDKAEATIQKRPFTTTVAAFAGGALIAALLSRK